MKYRFVPLVLTILILAFNYNNVSLALSLSLIPLLASYICLEYLEIRRINAESIKIINDYTDLMKKFVEERDAHFIKEISLLKDQVNKNEVKNLGKPQTTFTW